MFDIVYTKGNDVKVIKSVDTLEKAREEAKQLQRSAEYCDGFVTVETKTEKGVRIW